MISLIKSLVHRPAIRNGMARDSRGKFRDPRVVSFISDFNRKTLNTDFQDAVLRGRKFARYALVATLVGVGAWIVIESAHALSMF